MIRREVLWPALAVLVTLALLWVLCAGGPSRFLDTASYAAAVDALAHGRGVNVQMVPSFSQFPAAEFLRRGSNVPFVDFPLGHPLVAVLPGLLVGARRALLVVTIACSAATVALVVRGSRSTRTDSSWHLAARAVFAVALLLLPIHLGVIRAGLSEPLFILLLLSSAALTIGAEAARPQQSSAGPGSRRLRVAVLLAGAAGAVRFVGLPATAIPVIALIRRNGWRRAAPWALLAMLPAGLSALWATAAGGGHRVGWRGLTTTDLRFTGHSVAGWFSHGRGGFEALFRGELSPPWWAWAALAAWVVGGAWAVVSMFRRPTAHRALQVPLAMATAITAGLFLGMAGFDSLVIPDNRLMLPAGVLSLTAVVWWASARLDGRLLLGAVLLWVAAAASPWSVERLHPQPAMADLVAAVDGLRVVISDDADAVWWETGVPAAYLPQPTAMLTGEPVDQLRELGPLPCLLAARSGAIVLTGGPFADQRLVPELDRLVDEGALVREAFGSARRYTPTTAGCP